MQRTNRPQFLVLVAAALATGCTQQESAPTDVPKPIESGAVTVIAPNGGGTTNFGDAIARSRAVAGGISTRLESPDGALLATLEWSQTARTLDLAVPGGVSSLHGDDVDETLTLSGCNHGVYFYWKNVQAALVAKTQGTAALAPGCDFFPDEWETPCIRTCCDLHDLCWDVFGCNLLSWLGIGSAACKICNIGVVACIGACVFVQIVMPR
jgi:hypothetical protein